MKLTSGADILRFIKAHQLKLLGHFLRMGNKRMMKSTTDWKPVGKKVKGRSGKDG